VCANIVGSSDPKLVRRYIILQEPTFLRRVNRRQGGVYVLFFALRGSLSPGQVGGQSTKVVATFLKSSPVTGTFCTPLARFSGWRSCCCWCWRCCWCCGIYCTRQMRNPLPKVFRQDLTTRILIDKAPWTNWTICTFPTKNLQGILLAITGTA
jgi:hypothetical protein